MVKDENEKLSVMLGKNIMQRRKEKGMIQIEFADYLGIEQHSLSRMEKGKIAPKLSRIQQIAEGLDCTVADLFKNSSHIKSANVQAKATAIAELLEELDPDMQNVIFELVEKSVSVLKKKKK